MILPLLLAAARLAAVPEEWNGAIAKAKIRLGWSAAADTRQAASVYLPGKDDYRKRVNELGDMT